MKGSNRRATKAARQEDSMMVEHETNDQGMDTDYDDSKEAHADDMEDNYNYDDHDSEDDDYDYDYDDEVDETEEEEEDGEEDANRGIKGTMTPKEEAELLMAKPRRETKTLSSFQKFQDRMATRIRELETENVSAKPWTLGGEASNKTRPINSLLEEMVEFDQSIKPVPIITQQTTDALEELIRNRILEASWDDPVLPRINRALLGPRVTTELSTTRSSDSLAAIYEQQYAQRVQGLTPTDPLATPKAAVAALWRRLAQALDALSHFHYTPKAVALKKDDDGPSPVSIAPALALEEAVPRVFNDHTIVAPQELKPVLAKPLRAESELTREQRRSQHLKKKRVQKKVAKDKDALRMRNEALGNPEALGLSKRKESRRGKEQALNVLSRQRNVTVDPSAGGTSKRPKKHRSS